ncbi:hypothetical protein HKX48_000613 [Thoreauomyces humboldtii]|nr:hypothetical protein HKX48_000613 [Thoreauomyces humboldtii]
MASLPWKTGQINTLSTQDQRLFGAQMASCVIKTLKRAHNNNINQVAFPSADWNKWFAPGTNPTADPGDFMTTRKQPEQNVHDDG